MNTRLTAALLIVLLASAMTSLSQTPLGSAFTYQGRLNQSGQPDDGTANLIFRLYDAASGGNLLGTHTLNGVGIADGLFTVVLNGSGEFGASAFNGEKRWLDITVNGTPLLPRQELTATPNALFASNADRLDGLNSTVFLQTVPVPLTLAGSSNGPIIQGRNNSTQPGASGVLGFATDSGNIETYGVYGLNNSTGGHGVHGAASAATGGTFGMYGESASTSGIGVYGSSTAPSGFTFGGRFESASPAGVGMLGLGNAAGVHGVTNSPLGYGAFGESTAGQGTTWGVVGTSNST